MKKLILILLLLSCGLLYAETKTYHTQDNLSGYSMVKPESWNYTLFSGSNILAILPHEEGYILKLNTKNGVTLEYYIYKGFKFYTYDQAYDKENHITTHIFYECTITDIKPNEFVVKDEVVYSKVI